MITFRVFIIVSILVLISILHPAKCYQPVNRCPYAQLRNQLGDLSYASTIPAVATPLKPVPAPGFSGDSISTWLQQFFSNDYNTAPKSTRSNRISDANLVTSEINWYNRYLGTKRSDREERLQCAIQPLNCANNTNNYYYRSYDGSCNNLNYPGYGMANSRYSRFVPPKYGDGVYTPTLSVTGRPLPNARLLSLSLYGEQTSADNYRTLSNMNWGQLVGHDISQLSTKGAPEDCCTSPANKLCYPISLHPAGPITAGSSKSCLHFARSISDLDAQCPRSGLPYSEKITVATGYLDLSSIYGNSLAQHQKVRQYRGGLLKTSRLYNKQWLPISTNEDGECSEHNYQCYSIPDSRNQFTPTLAVLHTILLREHNRIATALQRLNPQYNDERIFQEARKINIAQYQKITYYDFLPLLIGADYAYSHGLIYNVQPREYVQDYNPNVNVAPYAEYAAAAYRYNHNQIPGWFSLVSSNRHYNQTMRLSDYFDRSENVNFIAANFDAIIRGLAIQLQKRSDGNIDKEIKHYFDRKVFEQYGADLKSFDIQRARDFGLPSYNTFRQYCGLPRAYDWSGFAREISQEKIALMRRLYVSPEDVELSVGGSFEAHVAGSILGPTFQCLIGRQFLKTRTGDRFFFERENLLSGFNRDQLNEIRKASLSGLYCNNADHLRTIQVNSFIYPSIRNILTNCHNIPQVDLNKWRANQRTSYNY